jgi:hypothetical protein
MTTEADAAAMVQTVKDNANRLGLTWQVTMATVVDGADPKNVTATFDGDDAPTVGLISMIGAPGPGDRVYVVAIPPAGNYIMGRASFEYRARQILQADQGSVVFDNIPTGCRELRLGYSALGTFVAPQILRMTVGGIISASYFNELVQGNAGVVSAGLVDGGATSTFIGRITSNVFCTGEIVFQGWDQAEFQFLGFTYQSQVIDSGGFYHTGGGVVTVKQAMSTITIFPVGGSIKAGSNFYLEGI